ncbi:MAG: hypothetical protein LBR83_03715 [Clostridiales bacterium]|jgi:hypothetical protein|nr:hypothetical protein [Clostridiales bacterium]
MSDSAQLLSFDEDDFDLAKHKKTAETRAQELIETRRFRRKLSFYKFLIMIAAGITMFLLYMLISTSVLQNDFCFF